MDYGQKYEYSPISNIYTSRSDVESLATFEEDELKMPTDGWINYDNNSFCLNCSRFFVNSTKNH